MCDKQPLNDDLEEIVVLGEEAADEEAPKRPAPSGEKKQKRWRDTSPSYASIAAESTSMTASGSPPTYRFMFWADVFFREKASEAQIINDRVSIICA